MGTVVKLKNQINNSYFQLKDSVDEKLVLVEEKIKSKLTCTLKLIITKKIIQQNKQNNLVYSIIKLKH